MDIWKFFDITHKEHRICNPTNDAKFSHLTDLLRLNPGDRVLELATGKGEFIIQMAEKYQVSGVGIDLSPFCIRDAKARLEQRAPQASIEFIEMEGAHYQPPAPHAFDLAACLGASWIFDGHRGTLAALRQMVKPGGWIVVGEPYWIQEPDPAYLQATDMQRETFGTYYENAHTGESLGLSLVSAITSSRDDWDYYESMQWYAADLYARQNPHDPDIPELMQRVHADKHSYLKWGRDTLGWAIYVFRAPVQQDS